MARTPSMTREQAETAIGTRRGHLLEVSNQNKSAVQKWMTAMGFKAAFVAGLSRVELLKAYNDTAAGAPFLSRLQQKQQAALELDPHALDEAITTALEGSGVSFANAPAAPTPRAPQFLATPPHGGAVEAAIQALIAATAPQAAPLDEARVKEISTEISFAVVTSALRDLDRPQTITHNVTVTRSDATQVTLENTHPQFAKLARAATAREPNGYVPGIFLAGEASSGKTTGCRKLAEAMNLTWYFNGAISMPHEMLGFIDAAGNYHRTPFRDAYEHGGVYTFDEVDRSDPVALLAVNPHLANGIATFPDGQVKRHPDCIIIATANTWGLGANADYVGATKLDGAFLSRFPVRINWDIDETLERSICGNATWAMHIQAIRQKVRARGLKVMIDVRQSIAGAALLAAGFNQTETAELTYLANLTSSQKQALTEGGAE